MIFAWPLDLLRHNGGIYDVTPHQFGENWNHNHNFIIRKPLQTPDTCILTQRHSRVANENSYLGYSSILSPVSIPLSLLNHSSWLADSMIGVKFDIIDPLDFIVSSLKISIF